MPDKSKTIIKGSSLDKIEPTVNVRKQTSRIFVIINHKKLPVIIPYITFFIMKFFILSFNFKN